MFEFLSSLFPAAAGAAGASGGSFATNPLAPTVAPNIGSPEFFNPVDAMGNPTGAGSAPGQGSALAPQVAPAIGNGYKTFFDESAVDINGNVSGHVPPAPDPGPHPMEHPMPPVRPNFDQRVSTMVPRPPGAGPSVPPGARLPTGDNIPMPPPRPNFETPAPQAPQGSWRDWAPHDAYAVGDRVYQNGPDGGMQHLGSTNEHQGFFGHMFGQATGRGNQNLGYSPYDTPGRAPNAPGAAATQLAQSGAVDAMRNAGAPNPDMPAPGAIPNMSHFGPFGSIFNVMDQLKQNPLQPGQNPFQYVAQFLASQNGGQPGHSGPAPQPQPQPGQPVQYRPGSYGASPIAGMGRVFGGQANGNSPMENMMRFFRGGQ